MRHWHANRRLGIPLNKTLGNTNTDADLSVRLTNAVIDWADFGPDDRLIEPAVGAGAFYFVMVDGLIGAGLDPEVVIGRMVTAMDIDDRALGVLRRRLVEQRGEALAAIADIRRADFLTHDFGDERFALVLTNPPYVSDKNIRPPDGEGKTEWLERARAACPFRAAPRSDLYAFFFLRSLALLADGGRAALLCSDSWADSGFGEPIKAAITGPEFAFETLINSQMAPFFRDDTNAVFTVIRRRRDRKGEVRVSNIRHPDPLSLPELPAAALPVSRVREIFADPLIPNKRNALILFGPEFDEVSAWFSAREDRFNPLSGLAKVSSSPVSIAQLGAAGLTGPDGPGRVPVFWQKQARVNAPPNYKTLIARDELPLFVSTEEVNRIGRGDLIRDGGLYLSAIIDRFPLVFRTDTPAYQVSKYLHLAAGPAGEADLSVRLQSVFSVLSMEALLKEGTRKTLRRGECGLAKEVSAPDLRLVHLPSWRIPTEITERARAYQRRVIYNLEDALLDPDYWAVQRALAETGGLSEDDLRFAVRTAAFLYVLRMRNVRKVSDFDQWFREAHENRLFG